MTLAPRSADMCHVLDTSGARPRSTRPVWVWPLCLLVGLVGCLARRRSEPPAREPGQSLVELAIVLPAVVLGLLLVIGLGILGQAKAGVEAVADEAARAGALTSTPAAAEAAATDRAYHVATGYGLDPARLEVTIDAGDFQRGGTFSVEVDYSVPLHELLPMIWGGDVALRHSASEPIDVYRTFR